MLVDHVELFRNGLYQMLKEDLAFDVIASIGEKENMLFHAYEQCPDILMINKMTMNHLYINMLQILLDYQPEVKIVVYSLDNDNDVNMQDLALGFYGYQIKSMNSKRLINVLKKLFYGYYYYKNLSVINGGKCTS